MPLPIIFISPDLNQTNQAISQELTLYGLNINHPDVLVFSDKIGVEQIKKIGSHLLWKSTGSTKKVIIFQSVESISLDAQNGLLKILEEPVGDCLILLGIATDTLLLPTVLSRCEIRYLSDNNIKIDTSGVFDLLSLSIEDRLDKIEKKEDRKGIVESLASYYYDQLPKHPELMPDLQQVLTCLKWINQNVSAKAVSDFLMVSLTVAKK